MLKSHMVDELLSPAAEIWLRLLEEDFSAELGNHAIHSEHVKFSSAADARMAMLRLAYLRGRSDATAQPADFEADVARIEAANRAKR